MMHMLNTTRAQATHCKDTRNAWGTANLGKPTGFCLSSTCCWKWNAANVNTFKMLTQQCPTWTWL
eukprot:534328-Pelagomonas_calceolata.AAC.2